MEPRLKVPLQSHLTMDVLPFLCFVGPCPATRPRVAARIDVVGFEKWPQRPRPLCPQTLPPNQIADL